MEGVYGIIGGIKKKEVVWCGYIKISKLKEKLRKEKHKQHKKWCPMGDSCILFVKLHCELEMQSSSLGPPLYTNLKKILWYCTKETQKISSQWSWSLINHSPIFRHSWPYATFWGMHRFHVSNNELLLVTVISLSLGCDHTENLYSEILHRLLLNQFSIDTLILS